MADITVNPAGGNVFEVRVNDNGRESNHRVTVPESLVEELQVSESDYEKVVRESFVFLLEREPASSIMPEFSLDIISRYFPEYKRELPGRL